jgi:hypothetical protein
MPELEEKKEETVVIESQQNDIADMLDGLMPAPAEQSSEEGKEIEGGDQGKERTEEKAGEQVEGDGRGEEKAEEVKKEAESEEKQVSQEGEKPIPEKPAPTEQKAVEEKKVEETELERLKRENNEFRQHMEELAAQTLAAQAPKQLTPEEQKSRAAAQAKQVLNFLKDDDTFDEVMKSSANFNALLTSVVNTAIAKTVQLLPNITTKYVDTQLETRLAVRDFYTDNSDLLPHRKYVGFVSNEMLAKNPDWSLEKNLEETEKEVRMRLKLPRVAESSAGDHRQISSERTRTVAENPGFVPSGGGGGRRGSVSADKLSVEEKGIMDLIS